MSERLTPHPEDLRPEHPELEPTLDEFLNDLGEKLDQPFSPAERRRQVETKKEIADIGADERPAEAEPAQVTFEKIEAQSMMQSRENHWAKLDDETRTMFDESRRLYVHIGHTILKMKGSSALVELSDQARKTREELDIAYNAYLGDSMSVKDFTAAVSNAHEIFIALEKRLDGQEK